MLAQNFKSAAYLNISDTEFSSLVTVLGMLERQELKHTDWATQIPYGFNMSDVGTRNECGTAACLLGWARIVSKDGHLFDCAWGNDHPDLNNLFMFLGRSHKYTKKRDEVTPDEAAIALRNYLNTGKARWDEVLHRADD